MYNLQFFKAFLYYPNHMNQIHYFTPRCFSCAEINLLHTSLCDVIVISNMVCCEEHNISIKIIGDIYPIGRIFC